MAEQKRRLITTGAVLFVVGIIVIVGLYLVYTSAKLSSLKQRNSRIAATLANITEKKINNIGQILENETEHEPVVRLMEVGTSSDIDIQLLEADTPSDIDVDERRGVFVIARLKDRTLHFRYFDDSGAKVLDESEASLSADRRHRGDLERLRQQLNRLLTWRSVSSRRKQEIDNTVRGMIPANRLNDLPCLHHVHWHSPSYERPSEKTESTIELETSDLSFRRKVKDRGTLHVKANLDCFFSDLSHPEIFDEVLIVDDSNRVIFQNPGSGNRIRTLLGADPGVESQGREILANAPWPIGRLHRQQIVIGGKRFVSFPQTLRLDFVQEQTGAPLHWEVVALVRSDRLTLEALRVPFTYLAYLAVGLTLLFCGWPLFEVWASSTRQRIFPIRHLWLGSIGLVLAAALLTLLTLDFGLKWRLKQDLATSLQESASAIESSLNVQVETFAEQLKCLNERYRKSELDSRPVDRSREGFPRRGNTSNLFGRLSYSSEDNRNEASGISKCLYPYLERVFWVNRDGKQVAKWSVGRSTPLINVEEREYFRRARDRDLWSSGYVGEAIRSWTTGKQVMMFAQPFCMVDKECEDSSGAERKSEDCPAAVVISTNLPSMLRPIMPPGRDFAVIDREGEVIFHSRSERNGVENFLAECEDASELQGVLFSGASRQFRAWYWGREHTMFARPLEDIQPLADIQRVAGAQQEVRPWYIVVFQEKDLLQTVRLEAMEVAGILSLLQIMLVVLGLAVVDWIGWLRGRGRMRSICPSLRETNGWNRIIAIAVLMILGLLIGLVFSYSPGLLIIGGLLFPLATVAWILLERFAPNRAHPACACLRWGLCVLGPVLAVVLLFAQGMLLAWQSWDIGGWLILLAIFHILVHAVLIASAVVLAGWYYGTRFDASRAKIIQPLVAQFDAARARFDPPSRRPFQFILAGTVLVAALSALPAATFHRAASQARLNLEVARGQLHLADALIARYRVIRMELADALPAREPDRREEAKALWRSLLKCAFNDTRDIHYGGYFRTCFQDGEVFCSLPAAADPPHHRCKDSASAGSSVIWRPLRPLFQYSPFSKLYYVNHHSVEARAMDQSPTGASVWSWRSERGRLVLAQAEAHPKNGRVRISSQAPPRTCSSIGVSCVIGAMWWGVVVVGGLVFMGKKVFLTDFQEQPSFPDQFFSSKPEATPFARLLVVVPPRTEIAEALQGNAIRSVDLHSVGTAAGDRDKALDDMEKFINKRQERLDSKTRLGVDDLEVILTDASLRVRALRMIEAALAKPRQELVLFSHGDPRAVLQTERERLAEGSIGSPEERALRRWPEILDRFTERWWDAGTQQETEDHFRDVWHSLAREERYLLAQIAEGLLVHSNRGRSLRRLVAWNLVERDPLSYRIKSKRFRIFVLEHYDRRALREWEEEEAVGLWRHVRAPFLGAVALLFLFLLGTQQEFFDVTFGVISAAAGSLLLVFRVFDALAKARPNT